MTRATAALLALTTPALVVACGPGQEAREPGALPTLHESHTIGCSACEGPEALSAMDVGLLDDGTVLVLNEFEPFVRVFDPAGELVRTIGRKGEGPGEIVFPGYLWVDDDGSFRVLDAGAGRLVGYGPTGEPLETLRYPPGMDLIPSGTDYDKSRRAAYFSGMRFRMGEHSPPTVYRVPFDGSDATMLLSGTELPGVEEGEEVRGGQVAVAVGPEGRIAVGNGKDYRIAIHDAEGNPIRELGRDLPRPRKSEEQLERERERSPRGREPDPLWPHFEASRLRFDQRGRLWVQTTHGAPARTHFDLFDPEAGYLGTVEIPAELMRRIPAFEIAGGRLAAVVIGEAGNSLVRVWEIDDG